MRLSKLASRQTLSINRSRCKFDNDVMSKPIGIKKIKNGLKPYKNSLNKRVTS